MDPLTLAAALALVTLPTPPQITLEALAPPAGADGPFTPRGIDYDGSVIVGLTTFPGGAAALRWTASEGSSTLPLPSSSAFTPLVTGVSASGEVVVGNYFEPGMFRAFRWTPETGTQDIGVLPGSVPAAQAHAISADGRVIVGGATNGVTSTVPYEAYRWTTATGFELLNIAGAGQFSTQAYAVDAGGSRVAGTVNQIPFGIDGFVFRDGAPTLLFSTLSSDPFFDVEAFSADGTTVVGNFAAGQNQPQLPFLWTEAGGLEEIPLPSVAGGFARFLSVSGDGGLVVGRYGITSSGYLGTFVWQRGSARSYDLRDALVLQGVNGASALEFRGPAFLSTDGRVVALTTRNYTTDEFTAYRVQLEPPSGAPLSTAYCDAQPPNSAGAVATLDAAGTNDASLNALELVARGLPAGTFGFFLASTTQTAGTTPAGSQGSLCLGGDLRGLVMTVMASDAAGTVRDFVDQDTLPGSMVVTAGSSMSFQAWYRDVGPTSRFSAAATVLFQ